MLTSRNNFTTRSRRRGTTPSNGASSVTWNRDPYFADMEASAPPAHDAATLSINKAYPKFRDIAQATLSQYLNAQDQLSIARQILNSDAWKYMTSEQKAIVSSILTGWKPDEKDPNRWYCYAPIPGTIEYVPLTVCYIPETDRINCDCSEGRGVAALGGTPCTHAVIFRTEWVPQIRESLVIDICAYTGTDGEQESATRQGIGDIRNSECAASEMKGGGFNVA